MFPVLDLWVYHYAYVYLSRYFCAKIKPTNKTYSAQTSITIEASIDRVWNALTGPKEIKKYLHGTNTKTDWVVGHEITWSGEWNGKAYVDEGEVLAYEPKRIIRTSHWSPLFLVQKISQ